jgi:hypothetical protein
MATGSIGKILTGVVKFECRPESTESGRTGATEVTVDTKVGDGV